MRRLAGFELLRSSKALMFGVTDPGVLALSVTLFVRVRLLLEQNFNFIETIGVIAVARYLFELSVWLKLFERDARYGLVYYAQLLDTQRRYFDDQRSQLVRDIPCFERSRRRKRNVRTQHSKASVRTRNRKP